MGQSRRQGDQPVEEVGLVAEQELSSMLWLEREALEALLYRMETEHLHLAAGHLRWLKRGTEEIEKATERLRFASLARAIESTAASARWLPTDRGTLAELAAAAPEPWDRILTDHLAALRELVGLISVERDGCTELLLRFVAELRDAADAEDPQDLLEAQVERHNCEQAITALKASSLAVVEDFLED